MPQNAAARKIVRDPAKRIADHLSGEDQLVDVDLSNPKYQGATEDFIVAAPGTKNVTPEVEVLPEPTSVMDALKAASEEKKRAQSAARKANGTANTKPDPKKPVAKVTKPNTAAKPKTTPKPKVTVDRVPAAEVIAFIDSLGITRSQFGQAVGLKPSSISEIVGKGRGHLLARSRWADFQKKAKVFAKGLK